MKQFFLFVFMLSFGISSAQFTERKEIEGQIKVPAGSEAEGITIFNKSSGRGTVSSEKGEFIIPVKAEDSLYFSAVQYGELLVVISEETVNSAFLNVEIKEGVNQLPEVIVRPHDLTGNMNADAGNIKVVPIPLPPSAMQINEYDHEMRPDMQTGVRNAALGGGGLKYGVNVFAILLKAVDLVFPKKNEPKAEPDLGRIELERRLRASFDNAFFAESLGLPAQQFGDFFDHLYEKGFPPAFLRKGKELDLLQFLMEKSEEFRNF